MIPHSQNPDVLASSRERLAFAKDCVADFERELQTFIDAKPYSIIVDTDPNDGSKIHKARLTKGIPLRIRASAIHCIEDLRSALDQLGHSLANRNGGKRRNNTYFPFGDTKEYVDGLSNRNCSDLPPEIFTLFRDFKPYERVHATGEPGDVLLWSLNKLANSSKHRILGSRLKGKDISLGPARFDAGGVAILLRWDSLANEFVICQTAPNVNCEYHLNLSPAVFFDKTDVLEGEEVLGVLQALVNKVSNIIEATDITARTLGLI